MTPSRGEVERNSAARPARPYRLVQLVLAATQVTPLQSGAVSGRSRLLMSDVALRFYVLLVRRAFLTDTEEGRA